LSVGFSEDDFGEGAAAVVLGQGGGVALDVGGDRAGVPGELEGDLLVVAGREVRVLPREDGGDECLVRGAVQGGSASIRPRGSESTVWVSVIGRPPRRRPGRGLRGWRPGPGR
jgi:hypothetical protein